MPILYDQDEYTMASALIEEPYPVLSLSNKLQVPWGAEYVLEGNVVPGVREPDWLYGEFTVHLSGIRRSSRLSKPHTHSVNCELLAN